MISRIVNNFKAAFPSFEGNPIKKVRVTVSQINGALVINNYEPSAANTLNISNATNQASAGMTSEQYMALFAQQASLSTTIAAQFESIQRQLTLMHQLNDRKFAALQQQLIRNSQIAYMTTGGNTVQTVSPGVVAPKTPVLSSAPRNLYILWREWTHGINGGKPASHFTATGIRANKDRFRMRRPIWEQIELLVRKGYTAEAAIERLYAIYGHNIKITHLSCKLKTDRKQKTLHPDLI